MDSCDKQPKKKRTSSNGWMEWINQGHLGNSHSRWSCLIPLCISLGIITCLRIQHLTNVVFQGWTTNRLIVNYDVLQRTSIHISSSKDLLGVAPNKIHTAIAPNWGVQNMIKQLPHHWYLPSISFGIDLTKWSSCVFNPRLQCAEGKQSRALPRVPTLSSESKVVCASNSGGCSLVPKQGAKNIEISSMTIKK